MNYNIRSIYFYIQVLYNSGVKLKMLSAKNVTIINISNYNSNVI